MPERKDRDRLWTAEEVAEYLGMHPQTVYAKARKGEIPSLKIGQARRFRPEEIDEWVDDQHSDCEDVASSAA